jgi:hypothetical protein
MKTLFFRIFVLLIGIAIALTLGEIFFRLNPRLGYHFDSFRNNNDPTQKDFGNSRRSSSIFGYEHIPNIDMGTCKINSLGLIGREYSLKKTNGIYRILILGDSIAERGQSPEILESYLNNNLKLRSKYRFEIWNAGVGSYDVRRYYLYLKYRGLSYSPDMVIIFLFMNDFDLNINVYYKTKDGATAYYFPLPELSKIYNPNPFLLQHSYLYRFLVLKSDAYLSKKNAGKSDVINDCSVGKLYLTRIKQICQRNNLRLFVVVFPYLSSLKDYNNGEKFQYFSILEALNDLKIDYLSLFGLYDKLLRERFPMRQRKEDAIHPTAEVHRMIAKELYFLMLNKKFIPTSN